MFARDIRFVGWLRKKEKKKSHEFNLLLTKTNKLTTNIY